MSVAIDVAILLTGAARDVPQRLNARFPGEPMDGFRFDHTHHAHVTLGQHFVDLPQLDAVYRVVAAILSDHAPLTLRVTGAHAGRTAQALAIAPAPALQQLHERVLDALEPFEVPGDATAFQSDDAPARAADVEWVTRYRHDSGYASFNPHITIGIGPDPITAAPVAFTAREIAVCHLGRFCTCRDVLARWTL